MAVEAKRGCGFRKVGGIYLVCKGLGMACGRLPIPLEVCPTCSCGIKQSRGWTWIDIRPLVEQVHCTRNAQACASCPLGGWLDYRRCGLLWIGEQFYPTPADFTREARELGVSRRIGKVPRDFRLGETWVALAHPRAVEHDCPDCSKGDTLCSTCSGTGHVYSPGIFHMFRPSAIEKIITESQATKAELARLKADGLSPVIVPDDDMDHRGSVYDDSTDDSPLFPGSKAVN